MVQRYALTVKKKPMQIVIGAINDFRTVRGVVQKWKTLTMVYKVGARWQNELNTKDS